MGLLPGGVDYLGTFIRVFSPIVRWMLVIILRILGLILPSGMSLSRIYTDTKQPVVNTASLNSRIQFIKKKSSSSLDLSYHCLRMSLLFIRHFISQDGTPTEIFKLQCFGNLSHVEIFFLHLYPFSGFFSAILWTQTPSHLRQFFTCFCLWLIGLNVSQQLLWFKKTDK